MEARIARYRRAVERTLGGRPGRGARYGEDLRQEAVVLARAGMLAGKSLATVAGELGVGCATLARWLEGARAALRPVEVQGGGREEEGGPASSLVLVAPSGWRIEGLRREDIPELLRVLG
jgi:transposase